MELAALSARVYKLFLEPPAPRNPGSLSARGIPFWLLVVPSKLVCTELLFPVWCLILSVVNQQSNQHVIVSTFMSLGVHLGLSDRFHSLVISRPHHLQSLVPSRSQQSARQPVTNFFFLATLVFRVHYGKTGINTEVKQQVFDL